MTRMPQQRNGITARVLVGVLSAIVCLVAFGEPGVSRLERSTADRGHHRRGRGHGSGIALASHSLGKRIRVTPSR
jgi:hypothetical protein